MNEQIWASHIFDDLNDQDQITKKKLSSRSRIYLYYKNIFIFNNVLHYNNYIRMYEQE